MADYRLSAQVIKRSDGKSSVASAAYRAAERLEDHRTGEIHNYTPKGGVEHSEIMAPDNTPDWMLVRQDLWNAVEKVERRKDAQLAREIQLSLPHELTQEQRIELVQGFAQEQFANKGMIADIAIHSPNPKGDERNHHAHIMLTMRELTSDGFGKKNRDWNSRESVAQWREQWANHQNRVLERFGHDAHVDHRSLADQGVDRIPQAHMGTTATEIERSGRNSRIGDENRTMDERNSELARQQAEAAQLATKIREEKAKLQKEQRVELEKQKQKTQEKTNDLKEIQERKRANLEADLKQKHELQKKFEQKKMLELRLKVEGARGLTKVFRDITGMTSRDIKTHDALRASLLNIRSAEDTARKNLELQLGREKQRELDKQTREKQALEIKQKQERDNQAQRQKPKPQAQERTKFAKPFPQPKPPMGAARSSSWPQTTQTQQPKKSLDDLWKQAKENRSNSSEKSRSHSNDNKPERPRTPPTGRDREP